VGNITAHDEFTAVKDISRDDMLAAHRTPPQLVAIIPKNNGGFGSVRASRDIFFENECLPIMRRMLRVNDWAGVTILSFGDYVCEDGSIWRQKGNAFVKLPKAHIDPARPRGGEGRANAPIRRLCIVMSQPGPSWVHPACRLGAGTYMEQT
jgi:hypothetical protein